MTTEGYDAWWELVAARIFAAIPKNGNPIKQADLAVKASRKTLPITPAIVRRATPLVEQLAHGAGQYINRPVFKPYGYSLTRYPWGAGLTLIQRWRHVTARITNDLTPLAMLDALIASGDPDVVPVAIEVRAAYRAFLDADAHIKPAMDTLYAVLRDKVRA